jgi:short-subunit dehydrogenase
MKTTLITGASSGIGRETALEFAKNGHALILVARRMDKLTALKEEITTKFQTPVELIDMDLSRTNSAEALYQSIIDKKFKIDILINNAGYGLGGPFINADPKMEEDMMILNMITLTKLTRFFAKEMAAGNGGTIINLASTAAFQPVPNMACYSATKAYVLSLTQALAYEFRQRKVKLLAICPGATQSEFSKVAGLENAKMFNTAPTSAELARFIYQSLGTKKYFRIHGCMNRFMKNMSALVPNKMVMAMTEKIMK